MVKADLLICKRFDQARVRPTSTPAASVGRGTQTPCCCCHTQIPCSFIGHEGPCQSTTRKTTKAVSCPMHHPVVHHAMMNGNWCSPDHASCNISYAADPSCQLIKPLLNMWPASQLQLSYRFYCLKPAYHRQDHPHHADSNLHCLTSGLRSIPGQSSYSSLLSTYLQGKVFCALWTTHWRRLAAAAGFCILQNLCSWSGPFLLQQLLSHLQANAMICKHGSSAMHLLRS